MAADASAALDVVSRVRTRTRLYRNGHWFASLVFGVMILGAVPFSVESKPPAPGRLWPAVVVGLLVLSGLERRLPFVVFAAGFFGLAVVSCLSTVVNVFFGLGIGAPLIGNGALPNLVVPGAYLVVGGMSFFAFRGRRLPFRSRPTPKTR